MQPVFLSGFHICNYLIVPHLVNTAAVMIFTCKEDLSNDIDEVERVGAQQTQGPAVVDPSCLHIPPQSAMIMKKVGLIIV